MLAATLIRLPFGTLGDIYTPVNVQIAGIYPTIVLLIVGLQMTIQDATTNAEPDESALEFALSHPSPGARSDSTFLSVRHSAARDMWTSRGPLSAESEPNG